MDLNPYAPPPSTAPTRLLPRRRQPAVPLWARKLRGLLGFVFGFAVANYFFGHPLGMDVGDDPVTFAICTTIGGLFAYCCMRFSPPLA